MIDISWVTPTLALGGRVPIELAEQIAREHRIAAVVDVRAEACDDAAIFLGHGIELLHLPTADHCAIAAAMIDEGVAFAARHLDQDRRVLIHCEHGIGRSPLLVLCVLVARGVAPLEALELAKSKRTLVSPSPAQYEAWASWLRRRDLVPPPFDTFAAIAYRHLRRS